MFQFIRKNASWFGDQAMEKAEGEAESDMRPSRQFMFINKLVDGRLVVRTPTPPKPSNLTEEEEDPFADPFGKLWQFDIPKFLLKFRFKGAMQLKEVFSAQRINYEDAFAYHLFFEAVEKTTEKTCNIFGHVEIPLTRAATFVPEVHFCEIITDSVDGMYLISFA